MPQKFDKKLTGLSEKQKAELAARRAAIKKAKAAKA